MELLEYKDYLGKITNIDIEHNKFKGKVINTPVLIRFEGTTPKELQENFEKAVDLCEANGYGRKEY